MVKGDYKGPEEYNFGSPGVAVSYATSNSGLCLQALLVKEIDLSVELGYICSENC